MTGTPTARRSLIAAIALLVCIAGAPAGAEARASLKKSIWGPTQVDGRSRFPIYSDLGARIYQYRLRWDQIARRRPSRSTSPRDPAYDWPAELDFALREARQRRIRVAVMVIGSPRWANGNRSRRWAPKRARSYANFMKAASRRYRGVRYWIVWGEPSRKANFMPIAAQRRGQCGRRLTRRQAKAPRRYARLLDAAYSALKRVDRRDFVVGGNTFTTGHILPKNWIRYMQLPRGRRPRMDLYGHNPFGYRRPNLRSRLLRCGFVDFGGLDTLTRWLDRYKLRAPRKRRLRLFLSEYFAPTDHRNHEFNFWVTRRTAASWLRSAFRQTRRSRRIHTLGWFSLYDPSVRRDGLQTEHGLLDRLGRRKPAYQAYKQG